MTELQTGRPPKGDWKKEISACSHRGHHLFQVKGKKIVCKEPGCGYSADWVKRIDPRDEGKKKK